MAPFAPFLSEHIYQDLQKYSAQNDEPISVHLCNYPQPEGDKRQPALEASVERFTRLVTMGRQKRNDLKLKLKTPLRRATVLHKDAEVLADVKVLADYIATELNIKEVNFSTQEQEFIDLTAKANFPALGKKLGKRMKHFAALIQKLTDEQLIELPSYLWLSQAYLFFSFY